MSVKDRILSFFGSPTETFLISIYSKNASEIQAATQRFLETIPLDVVQEAFSTAQETLYHILERIPDSLFNRVIAKIEQSNLKGLTYPFRLAHAKEEVIKHLSQNQLLMQDSWAEILGDRELANLSYRELNDLSMMLQDKRDRDLIAFIDIIGISPLFPQNGSLTERAAYIRKSLELPQVQALIPAIHSDLVLALTVRNVNIPPEARYLSSEFWPILFHCWIRDSDLTAILEYVLQPELDANLRTAIISKTLSSLKDNLPLFHELRKYDGFAE